MAMFPSTVSASPVYDTVFSPLSPHFSPKDSRFPAFLFQILSLRLTSLPVFSCFARMVVLLRISLFIAIYDRQSREISGRSIRGKTHKDESKILYIVGGWSDLFLPIRVHKNNPAARNRLHLSPISCNRIVFQHYFIIRLTNAFIRKSHHT